MSSYVSREDCDEYMGLRRLGPINFTVDYSSPTTLLPGLLKGMREGSPLTVKMPGGPSVHGYVTDLKYNNPIDGLPSVDVTMRPVTLPTFTPYGTPALNPVMHHLEKFRKRYASLANSRLADACKQEADQIMRDAKARRPFYVEPHPNCRSIITAPPAAFLAGETTMREAFVNREVKVPKKFNRFYVGSKSILPGGSNPTWAKGTLKDAIAHATELCEATGEEQIVVQVIRVVRKKPQPVVVETVK